ncbi:MAG: hypothetical protein ACK49J_03640, partial [Verrucomicrobiota bacterium]
MERPAPCSEWLKNTPLLRFLVPFQLSAFYFQLLPLLASSVFDFSKSKRRGAESTEDFAERIGVIFTARSFNFPNKMNGMFFKISLDIRALRSTAFLSSAMWNLSHRSFKLSEKLSALHHFDYLYMRCSSIRAKFDAR